jgi:Tol biopolymer transport system component
MPLATGTKLGPYVITGPLGAGGMGEVYQADDTRLGRTVAIKVLPSHLSANTEIRQRFEREARAVSSLNHPHICTLHDIGRENGIDYLVMEFLEGETLAPRIEKGPLNSEELLRTAIEITDALDKAHRQNIVHRDLKPGNVMMTKSGAKLLDFGLARTSGAASEDSDLTQSPTVSQPLTAEGTIVGTYQYMAPEQLEGVEVDGRTDIFALGAVLYEMATGRRAFEGKTQASLIASILKEDPRPIGELQPMAPPALERVVKRCLAKDPDDRWQTARDLMLELQWIRDAGSQAGVPAPVSAKRKSRERVAWSMVALLAVAAAVLGVPRMLQKPIEAGATRLTIFPPAKTRLDISQPETKVAPDGSAVVFAADDSSGTTRLWLRRFDTRAARPLPGTEGAYLSFWSPDSRSLAFFANTGKLVSMTVPDGVPQVVCDAPDGRGGTWGSDQVIVFAPQSGGPLYQVAASGGQATPVTALDSTRKEEAHRWPEFLPGGRHFLYVSLPIRNGLFDTYIGSLDSDERRHVVTADGAVVYAEPGYLLFSRDQTLVAQPFDTKRLELTGTPTPIGEAPGVNGGWTGAPGLSVSNNGVVVHGPSALQNSKLIWLDRDGRRQGEVPLSEGFHSNPVLSPDGQHLAVARWGAGSTTRFSDIWTVELSRGVATRFTYDQSENYQPEWSPDGRRIVFTSDRSGNENLYVKDAGSAGKEQALLESAALFTKASDWSSDGNYIVYNTLSRETGFDIWLFPLAGDRKPLPFLVTRFNETDAVVSPDGKRIAYRSDESGRFEIYVQSFPKPGGKYRVSTAGCGDYGDGYLVRWRGDGKELFYNSGDGASVMAAQVATTPRFQAGPERVLFRLPKNRLDVGAEVAADAERFLIVVSDDEGTTQALSVILNWQAVLANP